MVRLCACLIALIALATHQASAEYPWSTLLKNTFYFFEAQQSGVLPGYNRVKLSSGGWRSNAHTTDGSDIGKDLTGGYYDAGDHMKYQVPMTAAFSVLGLGAIVHEEGYRNSSQWDPLSRTMKYAAQYLVKAHLVSSSNPTDNVIVTQVGDTNSDHSYWGRPEQQTGYRPTKTTKDGKAADVMGGAAAVFAATAVILTKPGKYQDINFSNSILQRARYLLAAADAMPGTWYDNAYPSRNYKDKIALGYLLLCLADLRSQPGSLPATCSTALTRFTTAQGDLQNTSNYDWDNWFMGCSALLSYMSPQLQAANNGVTPSQVGTATDYITSTIASWQDTSKKCPTTVVDDSWFNVCYTAGGLAFLTKWGPLRHTCNVALATTVQAATLGSGKNYVTARKYRCWVRKQLNYIAGSNPAKQSYIAGYTPSNHKAADRPHHRSSSCDKNYTITCGINQLYYNGPSPNQLKGGLVGGPNNLDVFDNTRSDYIDNEVALDYEAGFSGALAALHLATTKLKAAGCSWGTYCSGGCDSAVDSLTPTPSSNTAGPSPSPPPSPPKPPSPPPPSPHPPSPPPPPPKPPSPPPPSPPPPSPTGGTSSSLSSCVADVPSTSSYACYDCLNKYPGIYTAVSDVCLTCPPVAVKYGTEWACASVCTNPAYFTTGSAAQVCVNCVESSQAGTCQQCLSASDTLATTLGVSMLSVNTQTLSCLKCVKVSTSPWACASCLSRSSLTAVNACLTCLSGNTTPSWQC